MTKKKKHVCKQTEAIRKQTGTEKRGRAFKNEMFDHTRKYFCEWHL